MPADPLDKQLVEAVLSRPRRAKADLEEAKLAGLRPRRGAAAVAEPDEDDADEDLALAPQAAAAADGDEAESEVTVEVLAEEDVGVPWLSARDRGLALLLKSGNFGGEDLFSRAAVRVAA